MGIGVQPPTASLGMMIGQTISPSIRLGRQVRNKEEVIWQKLKCQNPH